MRILDRDQIRTALAAVDLMAEIEEAFVAYSEGRSVVPPVGELTFDEPPGEVHIKYGYVRGEDYYVVKIASGFYDNPKLGLPSGDGLMLLFEQRTGRLASILRDQGLLTDVRTAVAGAIAAKYLAPERVERIGVVGTGVQARLQVEYLRPVTACKDLVVWGRSEESLGRYRHDMQAAGYRVETTTDAGRVARGANLIVTATPSRQPLLASADVGASVHVTAVGSDTVGKQELEAAILGRADLVVVDSRSQCTERGETAHALAAGLVEASALRELGEVIRGGRARTSEDQLTVADLTGVAVQDVRIASAVHRAAASRQEAEID
jgi:ornithine cyclodeaminase